jgi:hypothetical protein
MIGGSGYTTQLITIADIVLILELLHLINCKGTAGFVREVHLYSIVPAMQEELDRFIVEALSSEDLPHLLRGYL